MKTITIRDLRQRWPEAEAALELEKEILITRDSKPVAKLVRVSEAPARRPRWDAEAHGRWQKKVSGGKFSRTVFSPVNINDLPGYQLFTEVVAR
jgi:antitoxin (DNA-binding transcriptional repressor) of toxin-antitoxin stability system